VSAGDPQGAIATQLAALRLSRGDVAGARQALERAARPAATDAVRLLVQGDLESASGERDAARTSYRAAAAASPGWTSPLVREALLVLDPGARASRAALAEAADQLRAACGGQGAEVATLIALGRIELAAGRPELALRDAERASRLAPGEAGTWLLLADAHLATTDPDGATRAALAFGKARALRPDDAALARREVDTMLRAGDPASAVAAATRFLERHPDDPVVLRGRARARTLLDQWREAAEDYRRLAARSERTVEVLLALAQCQHRSGDREGALRTLEEARAADPQGATETVELMRAEFDGEDAPHLVQRLRVQGATTVLARAELVSGEVRAAVTTARRVLESAPGNPAATEVLVLGLMDLEPDEAAARDECRAAIRALDGGAAPWMEHYLEARVLLAERRWIEADAALTDAGESLPWSAVPVFVRGMAAFRAGRRAEGLDLLRRSIRLPGGTAALPSQVAAALFEASTDSRDVRRTEALLRECLSLDPDHPQAALRLSVVLALRGEFAASAAAAERGLQSPRVAPAESRSLRMQAAGAHVAAGNPELAMVHAAVLEKTDPDSPALPLLHGFAHVQSGRFDEAERSLAEARRRAPESPWPVLGLVRLSIARDDVAAALAAVRTWTTERPDDVVLAVAASEELNVAGRAVEAAGILRDVARSNPGRVDAAGRAVDLLASAGRTDEAVAAAREFRAAAQGLAVPAADILVARALTSDAPTAAEGLRLVRTTLADPGLPEGLRREARLVEARALLLSGSPAAARDAATAVLGELGEGAAPESEFAARDTRGLAASALGDWRSAAADLRRCVAIRPRDPRALNNAAWALAQVPESAAEGLALSRRATALRPGDPNYWSTRAVAAQAAGESDDAARSYAECLRRHEMAPAADPAGRARNALRFARHLRNEGRTERAVDVARSVAGFRPPPPADLLREAEELARP
jgi:tetratricopeptide (TPR) repeat protein